jgi:phosphoribosylcarboxyaminoimidazole (NCAIR) mutase
MPRGVPVATVAIGNAMNAGILAARILATSDEQLMQRLEQFNMEQRDSVEGKAQKLERVGYQQYLDEYSRH